MAQGEVAIEPVPGALEPSGRKSHANPDPHAGPGQAVGRGSWAAICGVRARSLAIIRRSTRD
jgi:hypothetical protein